MNLSSNFIWPLRVYYEDTDAEGVVYYVNYLKFMERARTEWLRSLGFEQHNLDVLFMVKSAEVNYLRPARLDDELTAQLRLTQVKGARLIFQQQILHQDLLLCEAEVALACVNRQTLKPCRLPAPLQEILIGNKLNPILA